MVTLFDCVIFLKVSFCVPSLFCIMQSEKIGGFTLMGAKKLKGARLILPFGKIVLTHAIGRGVMVLLRIL